MQDNLSPCSSFNELLRDQFHFEGLVSFISNQNLMGLAHAHSQSV